MFYSTVFNFWKGRSTLSSWIFSLQRKVWENAISIDFSESISSNSTNSISFINSSRNNFLPAKVKPMKPFRIGIRIVKNYQQVPFSKFFHSVQRKFSQLLQAGFLPSKPDSTAASLLKVSSKTHFNFCSIGTLIGPICRKESYLLIFNFRFLQLWFHFFYRGRNGEFSTFQRVFCTKICYFHGLKSPKSAFSINFSWFSSIVFSKITRWITHQGLNRPCSIRRKSMDIHI